MWPIIRGCSPSPRLVGRETSRGCSRDTTSLLSLHPGGLQTLLPQFYHETSHLHNGTEVILDRFIAECPELYPRTRYNPLREEELRNVYYIVLHDLSRTSLGEIDYTISDRLLRQLEESFRRDSLEVRGSGALVGAGSLNGAASGTSFFHRRSQHLFRSLAEVSHTNRSARLGGILYNFFIRHAETIVSTESSATIGQWCYAILRAVMRDTEKDQCLLRVCRLRPDLQHRLLQHGRKGEIVAERMQLASSSVSANLPATDLATADLLGSDVARGGLGMGSDLSRRSFGRFGLTGIRSRSGSRDRRLLYGTINDIDSIGDIDRIEGIAGNELALRQDEMLLGSEGERRMLQLELGPRYAQRFTRLERPLLGCDDGLDGLLGWDGIGLAGQGDMFHI